MRHPPPIWKQRLRSRCALLCAAWLVTGCFGEAVLDGSAGGGAGAGEPVPAEQETQTVYAQHIAPLFEHSCVGCHMQEGGAGGLDLTPFLKEETAPSDPELLYRVLRRTTLGEMPPPGFGARPSKEGVDALTQWIEGVLHGPGCETAADPGPFVARRLNDRQLVNSLRSVLLLPLSAPVGSTLPAEDSIGGFTNHVDVLHLNPEWVEGLIDTVGEAVSISLARTGSAQVEALLSCSAAAAANERECAREVLARFASRAYRRPLRALERDAVLAAFDRHREVAPWKDAVAFAMEVVLLSPQFLILSESESDAEVAPGSVRRLTPHQLATRLGYFLWAAPPDAQLRKAADDGTLLQPSVLEAQVARMMANGKRRALIDGFGAEWLGLSALDEGSTQASLRESMQRETKAFLREIFFDANRPVRELVQADFTFLNAELAAHYGLPPPSGTGLSKVSTAGTVRVGGLLTQGSVLTATSTPDDSSPVRRGGFVLERLLCAAPPPPPPEAEGEGGAKDPLAPRREQMAQHRADPGCASCHANMDVIGFGLENFDQTGRWREQENPPSTHLIDPSGAFPTGETFQDHAGLTRLISEHPALPGCVGERLLGWALGRTLTLEDRCTVQSLTRDAQDPGMDELVNRIVNSRAFQYRRTDQEIAP